MRHFNRREIICRVGCTAATLGLPLAAWSHTAVPTARITVGFPPGDMADGIARLVGDQIRGKYADTVIIDNKPGAAARMAIS